ncbi:hypothetical protein [Streptomyces chartreusis]|uniref:hypothetical protein n=1 Tax=Streptomyces chartreusis TaxID=1969 RepID=UPI0033EB3808
MTYTPPLEWPPPVGWPPPSDDWMPPTGWTPDARRPVRIPPDGHGVLLPGLPDAEELPAHEPPGDAADARDRVVVRMLALWARSVQCDAHSYYQAASKAAWTDRAIDYGEEWSPTEHHLARVIEEVWVRGYRLVMSAYQMERWLQAYQQITGGSEQSDDRLRMLRNTIEHLDEASFTDLVARKGPPDPKNKRKKWSIDELPGKELFLGFDAGFTEAAFGLVNLKDVTTRARQSAQLDAPDEPSFDDYVTELYDPEGD